MTWCLSIFQILHPFRHAYTSYIVHNIIATDSGYVGTFIAMNSIGIPSTAYLWVFTISFTYFDPLWYNFLMRSPPYSPLFMKR